MVGRVVTEFASALAILGTISSQLMNLSAVPSIREIYLAKSTLLYPAFPFMIALVASFCGLTYAIITEQYVVSISTMISMSLNASYLGIHVTYSQERTTLVRRTVLWSLLEIGIMMIGPAFFCATSSGNVCMEFTVGWIGAICTVVYCLVYCGQLSTFREVIRSRNSASISPWMTAGTLFCSLTWTWYAALVSDGFYLASSLIGDFSCIIQIFLILKFPSVPLGLVTPHETVKMKSDGLRMDNLDEVKQLEISAQPLKSSTYSHQATEL